LHLGGSSVCKYSYNLTISGWLIVLLLCSAPAQRTPPAHSVNNRIPRVALSSPASASKTPWPHAQAPALLNLARRLGWVPTFPARRNSETSRKPRYLLKYQVRRLNSASCSQR
ncbi:uncharacterized protein F5147DRAFT_341191, partial [Suillus discolor]